MPKSAMRTNERNEITIPADALRTRIDRALRGLIPYQEMVYDTQSCGYLIRTISTGPDHMHTIGPYYYRHFAGLGRHLGLFRSRGGKDLPPVHVYDRHNNWYPEVALPVELLFEVITPALAAMMDQLRCQGYTITKPPEQATATVTDAQPNGGN